MQTSMDVGLMGPMGVSSTFLAKESAPIFDIVDHQILTLLALCKLPHSDSCRHRLPMPATLKS